MTIDLPIWEGLPYGVDFRVKADDTFFAECTKRFPDVKEDEMADILKAVCLVSTSKEAFLDNLWDTISASVETNQKLAKVEAKRAKLAAI